MGVNVTYDPDFEGLKAEIAKNSGMDLEYVEKTAKKLLGEKSKDLRVIAFLGFALLRREKWEELADLFEELANLAGSRFDDLFPDRPRARQRALKWLSEERFSAFVEQCTPTGDEVLPHVTRLISGLDNLKPTLEQHFPDGSPFPTTLYEHALRWKRSHTPRPASTAQATVPKGVGTAEGSSAAQPAVEKVQTPSQARTEVRKAALFLSEKEPGNAMACRLLRVVRWDLLEKEIPHKEGTTALEGPSPQLRAKLQGHCEREEWKALFRNAEEAFCRDANHVWLDLQRYAHMACTNLGQAYAGAARAIVFETGGLLTRVPGLAAQRFRDTAPFCDAATHAWLQLQVSESESQKAAQAKMAPSPSAMATDTFPEVDELVARGKVKDAVALLQQQICQCNDLRQNFLRRRYIGQLLVQAHKPEIAIPILEELNRTIDRCELAVWEPSVAMGVWKTLAQAYRNVSSGKNGTNQYGEKLSSIQSRIARTDPLLAYELNN